MEQSERLEMFKPIANAIYEYRMRNDMTFAMLSEVTGVSRDSLYDIERALVVPRVDTMHEIFSNIEIDGSLVELFSTIPQHSNEIIPDGDTFGYQLRLLMRRYGLNKITLSRRCHVSDKDISRFVDNKKLPNRRQLKKLICAFDGLETEDINRLVGPLMNKCQRGVQNQ